MKVVHVMIGEERGGETKNSIWYYLKNLSQRHIFYQELNKCTKYGQAENEHSKETQQVYAHQSLTGSFVVRS